MRLFAVLLILVCLLAPTVALASGYGYGHGYYYQPTYTYHHAGWWHGKYYPAGNYYWNGNNWHLQGYGVHYGYDHAPYEQQQTYQGLSAEDKALLKLLKEKVFEVQLRERLAAIQAVTGQPLGQGQPPAVVVPQPVPVPPPGPAVPPGLQLSPQELERLKELLKKTE